MLTNEERREVAARLRGDPYDTIIPYRTGIHFGMGCHEAANRFWDMCERIKSAGDYDIAYSTCSVLADLIEPSCDRDALLALADEIDSMERVTFHNEVRVSDEVLVSVTRRIREALGATVDDRL